MNIIVAVLRLLLTALVFLVSYKVGRDVAESNHEHLECPKEVTPPIIASSLFTLPDGHNEDQYTSTGALIYHKNMKKSVNSRIFSSLEHADGPSKAEFILSSLSQWEDARTQSVLCSQVYRTNTGSRTNQPNKCVAVVTVPEKHAPPLPHMHRIGTTAGRVDQFINDYTRSENRREGQQMLPTFLKNIEELKSNFISIVGSPIIEYHNSTSSSLPDSRGRRTLVVMVANSGVFNLLLNFMCSCRSSGIDTKSIVVFVGEAHHVEVVRSMGATPVFLPAVGDMPKRVAGNYGDKVFGKMMWLKVSSVEWGLAHLLCSLCRYIVRLIATIL